jgi:outer membrane receptor protein involved in Fe transport
MPTKKTLWPVLGAIAALFAYSVCAAQADGTAAAGAPTTQSAGPTSSSAGPLVLKEVVVTAELVRQPLQNVPEAVSAVSGAELNAMGAQSFTSYARTVPGLNFIDLGDGRENVNIRGLSSAVGAATVGYYIGDIPIENAHGGQYDISSFGGSPIDPDILDLNRVEVLRGPQGTLYGSGSMGGTIKLVPEAPNLTQVEGSVGAGGQVTQGQGGASPGGNADLILNMPIVNGVAGVRSVFWGRDDGGFINRTYGAAGDFGSPTALPTGTVKNLPDEHTWGLRTIGQLDPAPGLTITAIVFLQDQHYSGYQDITGGATNPNNSLEQVFIDNVAEPQDNRFTLTGLTAEYDFGNFKALSATSYQINRELTTMEGTSATVLLPILFGISSAPAAPFPNLAEVTFDNNTWTEEARFWNARSIHGFDLLAGLFYENQRQDEFFNWASPQYNSVEAGNDPSNPLYAAGGDIFSDRLTGFERQTAEFGQVTYHVTHALRILVGLRHFTIPNGSTLVEVPSVLIGPATVVTSVRANSGGTVYKAEIAQNITPNHLLYFEFSQGFRPGFGNGPQASFCNAGTVPPQVNPDSLNQYELGTKTQWLGGRLRVNADVYQINWSSIQQNVLLSCGFDYTSNFGSALIRGSELDSAARVTDWLTAGLSGGYVRARLEQNTAANQCLITGSCAMEGDQILGVPNWQYSLYADSTIPLASNFQGFAHLDYSYTGHSFNEFVREISSDGMPEGPINSLYEDQPLRLLNLRIGLRHEAYTVSFQVANLLNNVAHLSTDPFSNITFAIPGRPRFAVNRPRTFMLNAVYEF